jgi:hypothetical protein
MAVGLGSGAWTLLFLSLTVLTVVLLSVPDRAIIRFLPRRSTIAIQVVIDLDRISVDGVEEQMARYVERVRSSDELVIERTADGRRATAGYLIQLDVRENLADVMQTLIVVDGVLRVAVVDEPLTPTT